MNTSNPGSVNPFVGLNPLLTRYVAAMPIVKVLTVSGFHVWVFYAFSHIHKALVGI